jgi:hypothetical protein
MNLFIGRLRPLSILSLSPQDRKSRFPHHILIGNDKAPMLTIPFVISTPIGEVEVEVGVAWWMESFPWGLVQNDFAMRHRLVLWCYGRSTDSKGVRPCHSSRSDSEDLPLNISRAVQLACNITRSSRLSARTSSSKSLDLFSEIAEDKLQQILRSFRQEH